MIELKPCPFCGGKGHISSREIRYIGQNYFGAKKIKMGVQLICGRCKARGGLVTGEVIYASYQEQRKCLEPLEHEAIEAWNKRAEPWRGEDSYTSVKKYKVVYGRGEEHEDK